MDFVGRKIVRDTQDGDNSFFVRVNPTTAKVKFSSALSRRLGLYGKHVGFGYEPDTNNPTGAALYVAQGEDGSKVSNTGDTQSKYHCETLARTFNEGKDTIFTVPVNVTAREVEAPFGKLNVYDLTTDETQTMSAEESSLDESGEDTNPPTDEGNVEDTLGGEEPQAEATDEGNFNAVAPENNMF